VDHQKINVRSQAEFPAPITAQRSQGNAPLVDFFGLVAERDLQEQRPDEPVHQVGVAPSDEKSRTLVEFFLDEGVSGIQKVLGDGVGGLAMTRWRPRLLLLF
jgi:hypothetical protein